MPANLAGAGRLLRIGSRVTVILSAACFAIGGIAAATGRHATIWMICAVFYAICAWIFTHFADRFQGRN